MLPRISLALTACVLLAIYAVGRATSSAPPRAPRTHLVQPYETLWTIAAADYRGDTREAIWRIEQANHMHGLMIRPGQTLRLP